MRDKIENADRPWENIMFKAVAKRTAEKYKQKIDRLKREDDNRRKEAEKEELKVKQEKKWKIARDLEQTTTSPLLAVRRKRTGPHGQAKGTIATQPMEVDAIVRAEYGKIYAGNYMDHRPRNCTKGDYLSTSSAAQWRCHHGMGTVGLRHPAP